MADTATLTRHTARILGWSEDNDGDGRDTTARLEVTCPEDGCTVTGWASWDGDDFSLPCPCGVWVGTRGAEEV